MASPSPVLICRLNSSNDYNGNLMIMLFYMILHASRINKAVGNQIRSEFPFPIIRSFSQARSSKTKPSDEAQSSYLITYKTIKRLGKFLIPRRFIVYDFSLHYKLV
jgi:hypothetical protein